MRVRTQILLFLALFALTPLLAAVVINVPLVFDRLEAFYHRAHLLNLRADFRDLDQHLASRYETVRLLAKLAARRDLLADPGRPPGAVRHADWLNVVLQDQLDIVRVQLLDEQGLPVARFERDPDTLDLMPVDPGQAEPPPPLSQAGLGLQPGTVLPSPVRFIRDMSSGRDGRVMAMQLISPMTVGGDAWGAEQEVTGAVVVSVDIGGLARAYRDTFWVHSDGSYVGSEDVEPRAALADFPGLEDILASRELGLWEGDEGFQVIWIPLLATEEGGPLWVGRRVDPSPIAQISTALQWRIGIVLVLLVVVILVVARRIANRAEAFRGQLTDGIGRILEQGRQVSFDWSGPHEVRALGNKLTRLARAHAENIEALHAHARELEESNRYKSEFLANVSHELRTPLNSILLLSKLLAEDPARLGEEQRKQAEVIHAAGRDLQSLIEDILDLSRIEARRTVFHLEHVYMRELVAELVELLRAQAESKGLYLESQVVEDTPDRVVTDPDKLRQILKNFLSNAIKFTDHGGVRLILDRNPDSDAESRPVRLTVEDTGIGIPEDKHQAVFRAFKQADGSTSRRYGGTGLGLTISRELARLMGGRIHLESAAGTGARFSLLLPVEFDRSWLDDDQYTSEGEEAAPEEAAAEPALPEANFTGRTVLLVDDDLRNLLTLTPLFERWGCAVLAAGDGAEALETLATEGPVDLVLLDLMMPGMDGEQTLDHLRADGRFDDIPIVVLTAKAIEDSEGEARRLGLAALLVKPLDPDHLRAVLQRLWTWPRPTP